MRFTVGPPCAAVEETLAVGELAHQAAMSWYGRMTGGTTTGGLSGRDASGAPQAGAHRHMHCLPTDEDRDGWIDHLTLWVPQGLSRYEAAACLLIDALTAPYGASPGGAANGIPIAPVGMGTSPRVGLPPNLVGPSTTWRSATPFVPSRHPKWRGTGEQRHIVDSPEAQLRAELGHRGLTAETTVTEALERPRSAGGGHRPFRILRRGESRTLPGMAQWWRLTFDQPVAGPLVLGYAAHFGLGLFIVDENANPSHSHGAVAWPSGDGCMLAEHRELESQVVV